MKKYKLLVAAMALSAACYAQGGQRYFSDLSSHQRGDLDRSVKNYIECLKSTNEGVVVSGLAHIARMKLYMQDYSSGSLEKEIRELSLGGSTFSIRYRANLVCSMFDNPGLFAKESRSEFKDPDELFTAIAERLKESLLGSDDRAGK